VKSSQLRFEIVEQVHQVDPNDRCWRQRSGRSAGKHVRGLRRLITADEPLGLRVVGDLDNADDTIWLILLGWLLGRLFSSDHYHEVTLSYGRLVIAGAAGSITDYSLSSSWLMCLHDSGMTAECCAPRDTAVALRKNFGAGTTASGASTRPAGSADVLVRPAWVEAEAVAARDAGSGRATGIGAPLGTGAVAVWM